MCSQNNVAVRRLGEKPPWGGQQGCHTIRFIFYLPQKVLIVASEDLLSDSFQDTLLFKFSFFL